MHYLSNGIINEVTFEIKIIDSETKKTIWKGELEVYGQLGLNDSINESLKKLIQKLKQDKLI